MSLIAINTPLLVQRSLVPVIIVHCKFVTMTGLLASGIRYSALNNDLALNFGLGVVQGY